MPEASPEERLLRVIQESKESSPEEEAVEEKPAESPAAAALPVEFRDVYLKLTNRVLVAVLIAAAGLTAHYATKDMPDVQHIAQASLLPVLPPLRNGTIEVLKPAAFYLKLIEKRDIFKASPREETKTAASVTPPKNIQKIRAKLVDMAGDLTLTGVDWSTPMVMIRSKKNHKTYFLKENDTLIFPNVRVKTILRDRVIIISEGEEMELSLQ